MALEHLKLSSLHLLDEGRVERAFALALQRALADCEDRPALPEKRVVALRLNLTPVASPEGRLETCEVEFEVVDAQPKRRSRPYSMRATPTGLFWNELSPDDVRQRTLDEQPAPRALPAAPAADDRRATTTPTKKESRHAS